MFDLTRALRRHQVTGGVDIERASVAGSFVDGRFIPPSTSVFNVLAAVHTVTGQERLLLPELMRTREMIAVYTENALQTSDTSGVTAPDTVTYEGDTYQVETVENWSPQGNFFKSICVREGQ